MRGSLKDASASEGDAAKPNGEAAKLLALLLPPKSYQGKSPKDCCQKHKYPVQPLSGPVVSVTLLDVEAKLGLGVFKATKSDIQPELQYYSFILFLICFSGELSQEAEEVAAEERRVLSSIDGLINELSREKEALLVSLKTYQVNSDYFSASGFSLSF